MDKDFYEIQQLIINDPMNAAMRDKNYVPIYTAGPRAKIAIVGQAPGSKAQSSLIPWNDLSGQTLRRWLNVSDEQFYNPDLFALIPMDFYYPGKAAHGDLPPRKDFAATWHPRLLERMPDIQLIIVIGAYAQKYYLGSSAKRNLTKTVFSYQEYLPKFFPLVHPSPLNFRWHTQNPWFELDVVPKLGQYIHSILSDEQPAKRV